jgi:hypothetical protein
MTRNAELCLAGLKPLRQDQVQPLVAAMYAEQKQVEQDLADCTATLRSSGGEEGLSRPLHNERHAQPWPPPTSALTPRLHRFLAQRQLESPDEMLRQELDMAQAHTDMMRARDGMEVREKPGVAKANGAPRTTLCGSGSRALLLPAAPPPRAARLRHWAVATGAEREIVAAGASLRLPVSHEPAQTHPSFSE